MIALINKAVSFVLSLHYLELTVSDLKVVIMLIGAYSTYFVFCFVSATLTWKLKNIHNKQQAVEIFAEARRQFFRFDKVD